MFDNFGMIQASINPLIVFSWEGYNSTKLCIIEEARNIDVWGAQLKFVLPEPFPLPPPMSPVNVLCQPCDPARSNPGPSLLFYNFRLEILF